eukprot:CAMPEP_0117502586 /NCGR_PEP_ID=MMETSP0784-20121206/23888_1 /TAXON_ID=39447 /ORGANISM="" /LENGTH=202 /DNA_ID=CAMNT_0005297871 /DNA_START=18 /DNA_END=626 /DNA_ORIENTATION=+
MWIGLGSGVMAQPCEDPLSFLRSAAAFPRTQYVRLAGLLGACSLSVLGGLSLLDSELSLAGVMRGLAQSAALLILGLACVQGERSSWSQLLDSRHALVQEYLGFAMVPLGRAMAYFLAALHCLGVRGQVVQAESWFFRTLWYSCCLLALAAAGASAWAWNNPPQLQQEESILERNGEAEAQPEFYQCLQQEPERYQPPRSAA